MGNTGMMMMGGAWYDDGEGGLRCDKLRRRRLTVSMAVLVVIGLFF
jgi:hypothetical protein